MMVLTKVDRGVGRSPLGSRFATGRVREKGRTKQRLRGLVRVVAVLALAIASAFGMVALYRALSHTEYFTVKTINVTGLDRLDKRHVQGMVTPLLSGNIFTRDIDRATRLLEQFPQVDSVSVRLKLPDIAEVTVVERRPVATLALNGKLFLIDAKRHLIGEADGQASGLLIKGIVASEKPGERVGDPRLADAFSIAELFSLDTVYRDAPVFIDMGNAERVDVRTSGGLLLRFGPDRQVWREKFFEYLSVRGISGDMGVRMLGYDLSFKGQIVGIRDNNQPSGGSKSNRG